MRAAALLVIFLSACAHVGAPGAVVSDRLFCGLSIPGGGSVSEAEVERFIDEVVEPRFPDGFTVWRARGGWRGGREEVLVLEIIRSVDAVRERRVAEIAEAWRIRFRQEAVLRVITPVRMDLVTGRPSDREPATSTN